MSADVEATAALVDDLLRGSDSVLVEVPDVDTVAHALTSATGAQIFDSGRSLGQAIESCVELRGGEVLFDIDSLRAAADRLTKAELLTERSVVAAQERLQAVSAVVMHPDSIRKASAEVFAARDELVAAQEALEAAESAPLEEVEADAGETASSTTLDDASLAESMEPVARGTNRDVLAAVVACIAAAAVGALVLVLAGSPLGFVLILPAVAWVVATRSRGDDDAWYDEDAGVGSLANMEALSDLAFPQTGAVDTLRPSEAIVAAAEARDRASAKLRLAENRWVSLVGPEVPVDDVDAYLRLHDPQFLAASSGAAMTATPVLAATRRLRRIEAQWRAMWWSLDRDPPPVGIAEEAIEELSSQGVTMVTTEIVADRLLGRPGPEAVVVVVDRHREISPGDFATRTSGLPTGARVIALVASEADDDPDGDEGEPAG